MVSKRISPNELDPFEILCQNKAKLTKQLHNEFDPHWELHITGLELKTKL